MEKYLLNPKVTGATLDDSEVVVPHNYEQTERLRQEIKKQKRNLKKLLPSISGVPVDNYNDTMTNFVYILRVLRHNLTGSLLYFLSLPIFIPNEDDQKSSAKITKII